jgi:uncharacterized protein YaaW (UPF0174 family)
VAARGRGRGAGGGRATPEERGARGADHRHLRKASMNAVSAKAGNTAKCTMPTSLYRRGFLIATVAVLGYALFRMLAPLAGPIAWALTLAFLLAPLQRALARASATARPPRPA